MKKIFIPGIIGISLIAAVFLAACNNAATEVAKNPNVAVLTNSMTTNRDAPDTTGAAKLFTVDFKSEPTQIQAGMPVMLSFIVKDKQGATVKDLSIVHEKPMHLLVVSKDLAEFYHIHPEQQADGSYRVSHTFPNGGEYKFYADFTPREATQVVEQIDVKVAGTERAKVALVPDEKLEKTVEGLKIVMKPSQEIKAGQELMLDFQAFDAETGKPVNDLQNYLGALAHFVIISEDMQDFVHAHPMSKDEHDEMSGMKMNGEKTDSKSADGHNHSTKENATTKTSQSEVSAHTAFPRSGLYKLWAQFQRGGKVINVPFIVRVPESDQSKVVKNEPAVPADAVKVTVSKNGFEPSEIKIEKGKPIKLAFIRTDAENCGGEVVFSKLQIRKKLLVGEIVSVEFTPTDTGEIAFACGMGMMKGKVLVR